MQTTFPTPSSSLRFAAKLIALSLGLVLTSGAFVLESNAQVKKKPSAQGKSQKVELIEPELLVLETKDKVQLQTTYFSPVGAQEEGAGKSIVPIILLHDWEGDRSQVLNFGRYLQQAGFAVIAPDLRGHGESLTLTGESKPLDYKRFRKTEIATVLNDIERCKKYLVQRHNEGKLNVDLLTVVAVGKTSTLAVQWTIRDWSWAAYNSDGIKQGKDVKSLILVSPRKKMESILLTDQLKHPLFSGEAGSAMPMMIVWGKGKAAKDAEYLAEKLEKSRPDISEIKDKAERSEKKTLYTVPINQSLTGIDILEKQRVKGLWKYMAQFVQNKVAAKAEAFPWKTRDLKDKEEEKKKEEK